MTTPMRLIKRQEEDLAFLRANPAAALWHEVGVGKTPPVIYRVLELLDGAKRNQSAIIVCPRTLFGQWEEKIRAVAEGYNNDAWRKISIRTLTGGSGKDKIPHASVYLMNYEYIPSIEDWLTSKVDGGDVLVMVLDEAHRIKGFRGFRSKHGVRARILNAIAPKIPNRIAMSGSPVLNPNSSDVWAMYHWLDPRIFGPTRWKFINEFFYNLAQGQPYERLILKPGAQAEISRRMYGPARRILKSECMAGEFPEPRVLPYYVEMPEEVARLYKDMHRSAVTVVDGETITREMILARLMLLQQIASGFIKTEAGFVEVDSSHKLEVMDQLLTEIGDKPVIVWAHFRHEIEMLEKWLKNYGRKVVTIYGGVPQDEAIKRVRAFQTGDADTFLGHPAAAGAGLDLQRAQDAIRYSRSYILEHYEQSMGRNNRAFSEFDATNHHEIVAAGTEDHKIYLALKDRKNLAAEITMDFFSAETRNAL